MRVARCKETISCHIGRKLFERNKKVFYGFFKTPVEAMRDAKAGETDLATEHLDISLRLNPRDRRAFHLTGLGIAHCFNRRFEEAVENLLVSLEELPSYVATYRFLASCYAHLGRLDEAREVVGRLRTLTTVVVPAATF